MELQSQQIHKADGDQIRLLWPFCTKSQNVSICAKVPLDLHLLQVHTTRPVVSWRFMEIYSVAVPVVQLTKLQSMYSQSCGFFFKAKFSSLPLSLSTIRVKKTTTEKQLRWE